MTLPGDLKKALRGELDDIWIEEARPTETFTCIVEAPDGEVYAMTEDLRVFLANSAYDLGRQVADLKTLGISGCGVSKLFYDDVNDEWLVFYQRVAPDNRICQARVSRDFKTLIGKQEPMLIDGTQPPYGNNEIGPAIATGDFGHAYGLALVAETQSGAPALIYSSDFSARPLPSWTLRKRVLLAEAPSYGTYAGAPGKGFAIDGGTQAFQAGEYIAWLIGTHSQGRDRTLRPAWMILDREKGTYVAAYSPLTVLPQRCALDAREGAWGFALTGVWKRELNLYVAAYKRKGAARISKLLVYRLPPRLLRPDAYPVVIWHIWVGDSIAAGDTSPAILGYGRKTIHFTSSTAGDLTVYLDAIGRNDWKPLFTQTGVTSVLTQTRYSGLRMRLGFSVAATVSAYVVVEH